MLTPPLDLELDALDLKKLKRLAIGMHLEANLTSWHDRNIGQEALAKKEISGN
jgi:hypothetical protein